MWLFLILFLVIVLINTFVCTIIKVNKTSMLPTLQDGDYVFLSKTAYVSKKPVSGDIIVFRKKTQNGSYKHFIKRVIGIPGDEIKLYGDHVLRNGEFLDEPYIGSYESDSPYIKVPKNCYFVLGDNRKISIDSRNRSIGFVRKENIVGKILFKVRPFENIDHYSHKYADKK